MLLFLTTNMAAVTSSTNQQYWQLTISRNWQIENMEDWARIHERFVKTSNEVTKRGILTNGDYKKMANLGQKGKNGELKGLAKSKWDNKKGHLDIWRFYENDKFGKKLFPVWQKLKQDDKRGMSIIVGFTKMTYFAKPVNLARIDTMR